MKSQLACETECEICLDRFSVEGLSEPRVCPCGHTFCMKCLLALPKANCPNCRLPIQGNVSNLPKNYSLISLLSHASTADRKREDKYELLHEKMRIEKALASIQVDEEEDENKNSILISISKLEEERTIETEALAVLYQNIEKLKLEAELKRLSIENVNAQIKQHQKALADIGISARKAIVDSYLSERDTNSTSDEEKVSASANNKNLLDEIKTFPFLNRTNVSHSRASGQRPSPPPPPPPRMHVLPSSGQSAVVVYAPAHQQLPSGNQNDLLRGSSSLHSRGRLLHQIRSRFLSGELERMVQSIPA